MWRFLVLSTLFLSLVTGCYKGKSVDLIIHNARIYSMNANNDVFQAVAIADGKIVELGPERQILNKYKSDQIIDAQGRDILPSFTDAHGHMMGLIRQKLSVSLFGSTSMTDLIRRTERYKSKSGKDFIVGRGWDQSLWGQKELPNNDALNKAFPDVPVVLYRVDGHALLANDTALVLAGIDTSTQVSGGMVVVQNGKCSGLVVDNAMELINKIVPAFTDRELLEMLKETERELLQYGIASIHEAGVDQSDFQRLKKWDEENQLSLNYYVMLSNDSINRKWALENGHHYGSRLTVRSFKMYGDGALGSRGALLKAPYEDEHDHFGLLTTDIDQMQDWANFCMKNNFQLNTHAIGDSTNKILLDIYRSVYSKNPDHRWRIEHAQVTDPEDFKLYQNSGIIPSVQPTHAVSDQRWAKDRLGENRLRGAYAYKTLLSQAGIVVFGTDFPVEDINPFKTLWAACARKNAENQPKKGFLPDERITFMDALRAMTIWPAIASFSEEKSGSLEVGKNATLSIFKNPLTIGPQYADNFATHVFINGRLIYEAL